MPFSPSPFSLKGKLSRIVSQKKTVTKPTWSKNTFFWIAGLLALLALVGLPFLGGDRAIRDPGQKAEHIPLFVLYLGAAIIMVVNGVLSHRQTMQQHEEESEPNPETT